MVSWLSNLSSFILFFYYPYIFHYQVFNIFDLHFHWCIKNILKLADMLVKTFASAVTGIDAVTVTIVENVSCGVHFFLVGLPDVGRRKV